MFGYQQRASDPCKDGLFHRPVPKFVTMVDECFSLVMKGMMHLRM